jgi:hypothetical protein
MNLDVGPFRLKLPPGSMQLPTQPVSGYPSIPTVRASVGPFELSGSVIAQTLQAFREHINSETRGRAVYQELCVNGVPGLRLVPGPENRRRLDYAFEAIGRGCLNLVAWSDRDTTLVEMAMIDAAVRTVHLRDPHEMIS